MGSLQEQGNAAFRGKRWAEALSLYQQALEAAQAVDPKSEAVGSLFSNISATRIHLHQYDRALLDASSAMKIRPTWSRAAARSAEAMTRLQMHSRAAKTYEYAITLAETEEIKKRYEVALAIARKASVPKPRDQAIQYRPRPGTEGLPPHFNEAYQDFLAAGGVPVPNSAAELTLASWKLVEKGMNDIDNDFQWIDHEAGSFRTKMAGMQEITEGLLADDRALHVPPSRVPNEPIFEKLVAQLQHQSILYGHHLKYHERQVPEKIIDDMDSKRRNEGWEPARKELSAFIRGMLLSGVVAGKTGDQGDAIRRFRYAIDTLKAGQARWPDVPDNLRGMTLRFTFLRAMQCLLIQQLESGWFDAPNASARRVFSLEEIEELANEVLKSCTLQVLNPDGGWLYSAFQTGPHVVALTALGFVWGERSRLDENRLLSGVARFHNREMAEKASDAYRDAAALLPADSAARPQFLFHSLSYSFRAGGCSIRNVFDRAAVAEAAFTLAEHVYGEDGRQVDSYSFVQTMRAGIQGWLDSEDEPESALDTTLKPIPVVYQKDCPEDSYWEENVDRVFLAALPGQLALAEVF